MLRLKKQLKSKGAFYYVVLLPNTVIMVRMAPNSALITAVITAIEPYAKQQGFSILLLKVQRASKKEGATFLYNSTDDDMIRALISNEKRDDLKMKTKDTLKVELNKVSIDLWRVIEIM